MSKNNKCIECGGHLIRSLPNSIDWKVRYKNKTTTVRISPENEFDSCIDCGEAHITNDEKETFDAIAITLLSKKKK